MKTQLNFRTAIALVVFVGFLAGGAHAATIISAQFGSTNRGVTLSPYSGVEPDAAAADSQFGSSNNWNLLLAPFASSQSLSYPGLQDSMGADAGVTLDISHINGGYNHSASLPDTYIYSIDSSQTFEFSGLAPDESFTLFLYVFNSGDERGAVFTIAGASFDSANGATSSEDPAQAVTGVLKGMTSSTGTITGTWSFGSQNTIDEIDWSGFQLAVDTPSSVPEPATLLLLIPALGLLFCLKAPVAHALVRAASRLVSTRSLKPASPRGLYHRAGFTVLAFIGLSAGGAHAATIISAQFGGSGQPITPYSGVEPDAAAADAQFGSSNIWNLLLAAFNVRASPSFMHLVDSTGADSGAALSISHIDGGFDGQAYLPDTYIYSSDPSQTFEISGLAPDQSFTLFLYGAQVGNDAAFTANGASVDTSTGPLSSEVTNVRTGLLTGTTTAAGTITGTWSFGSANGGDEVDWGGFQLAVGTPSSVPEPGTLLLLIPALGALLCIRRRMRSTLTLAALAFIGLSAGGARAATIISTQFGQPGATPYSGVEPDAAAADAQFGASNFWNLVLNNSVVRNFHADLRDSTGASTGAALNLSQVIGGNAGSFPDSYIFSNGSETFEFSGLAPDESFTLFLYVFTEPGDVRETVFTAAGASFDSANGAKSSEAPNFVVTGILTGTTSATGTITGTWSAGPNNNERELDWSGFQLAVDTPGSVPEPGTLFLLIPALGALMCWRRRKRSTVTLAALAFIGLSAGAARAATIVNAPSLLPHACRSHAAIGGSVRQPLDKSGTPFS